MLTIAKAQDNECTLLTELALRSKAHWSYDADFMIRCRAELTVTPERLAREYTVTAREGERVLGFAALAEEDGEASIELFFVEPEAIGKGVGRALMDHLEERARAQGISRLMVESDPQAEAFYERCGFRRIGEAPSQSIPGRKIPLLERELF